MRWRLFERNEWVPSNRSIAYRASLERTMSSTPPALVHFSMIAICIALIVIASSRSRTEITEASEQLQLIIESLHSWDPGFLEDAAKRRIAEVNSKQKEALPTSLFVPTPAKANMIFLGPSEDFKIDFLVNEVPKPKLDGEKDQLESSCRVELDRRCLPPTCLWALSMDRIYLFHHQGAWPAFRALWDALASTTTIIVPTKLAQTMYTFTIPEEGKWDGDAGSLTLPPTNRALCDFEFGPPPVSACTLMLARTDPDEDPVLKTIATALAKPTPYMYVCLEQSKSDSLSFIPVTDFETIDFDAQDILLSKVRSQQIRQKEGLLVPHGIFDYSFRSLNNVTKNYQNLALGSFKPILESEQQRTGESFEALGIKFPVRRNNALGNTRVARHSAVPVGYPSRKCRDDQSGRFGLGCRLDWDVHFSNC